MSPTSSTGEAAAFAIPMFTNTSASFRLISAGLPAPSITMTSFCADSVSYACMTAGISVFLTAK